MSKTATFIKRLKGWAGDAHLYKLSEPMPYSGLGDEIDPTTDHVIVSAVVAMFSGPETYIFPSHPNGTPICYTEQHGSFRGGLDHTKALANAGYEIA